MFIRCLLIFDKFFFVSINVIEMLTFKKRPKEIQSPLEGMMINKHKAKLFFKQYPKLRKEIL